MQAEPIHTHECSFEFTPSYIIASNHNQLYIMQRTSQSMLQHLQRQHLCNIRSIYCAVPKEYMLEALLREISREQYISLNQYISWRWMQHKITEENRVICIVLPIHWSMSKEVYIYYCGSIYSHKYTAPINMLIDISYNIQ